MKNQINMLGYIAIVILIAFVNVKTCDYFVVEINTQVWMSKNLDVSTFNNGDSLFFAKSQEEWLYAWENKLPAFCYYNYDSLCNSINGKLYNWYAIKDSRKLPPDGWKIPSKNEWGILWDNLGGAYKVTENILDSIGWFNWLPSKDVITEELSFGPVYSTGKMAPMGIWVFWTSTKRDSIYNITVDLFNQKPDFWYAGYNSGLYVRCIKE